MRDSAENIRYIIKEKIKPKRQIKDFSFEEMKEYFESKGEANYRVNQLFDEIYSNRALSFFEMTTLPKGLRQTLSEEFSLHSLKIDSKRISQDGSIKYLFELNDSNLIEAVYMPWINEEGEMERSTLCISSMAGCPAGCAFCATGMLGFKRNLTPSEIIEQIMLVEADLNLKINNVVIMGMGEPLLNYANVVKSLQLMTGEKSKIIGRRKITLSTAGIATKIKLLANIDSPPKLAISLHATTNATRQKIIPISKSFDISSLMDAIEFYYRQTKMPITYEYIVFDGFNDTPEDAERLRKIALRVPSRVNFIPYNDISFTNPQGISKELKPATSEKIAEFANALRSAGVAVIVRDTYGRDIEAACGQLALSKDNKVGE